MYIASQYVASTNPSTVMLYYCSHSKIGFFPWWRHQMETFSALLALCAGNSPVTVELPSQRPVTRSFDVFFDLCLNKRISKQSWGWWFETTSRPLWRHCNVFTTIDMFAGIELGLCSTHVSFFFYLIGNSVCLFICGWVNISNESLE